jgi:hypothetical protein
VSPRRGDRVTVPPPQEQWDVRFGTGDAADGWEELCRHALATHRHNGRDLEQWEYEVTSGGRVRYVIDDGNRTVWLIYASPRHPKDTDR